MSSCVVKVAVIHSVCTTLLFSSSMFLTCKYFKMYCIVICVFSILFLSGFSFSLLDSHKIDYDTLHDLKVIADRAMRICDMLVPIGKKQYF